MPVRASPRLNDLQSNLAQLRGMDSAQLNTAVRTTVSAVPTDILARFRGQHPRVPVHLDVSNRESVLGQLAANRIDLAIMGQVPGGLDLEATRFMDNPLVVIAPPEHPLARKKKVSISELASESFLVREAGAGTRGAMERFFRFPGDVVWRRERRHGRPGARGRRSADADDIGSIRDALRR